MMFSKHQQILKDIISHYIFFQFYTMRLLTGMEIVWLQNVHMGQRKGWQRGVHHLRYQCVVCK
jgi:hypothetical protein